jgi:hypothetical protein
VEKRGEGRGFSQPKKIVATSQSGNAAEPLFRMPATNLRRNLRSPYLTHPLAPQKVSGHERRIHQSPK